MNIFSLFEGYEYEILKTNNTRFNENLSLNVIQRITTLVSQPMLHIFNEIEYFKRNGMFDAWDKKLKKLIEIRQKQKDCNLISKSECGNRKGFSIV